VHTAGPHQKTDTAVIQRGRRGKITIITWKTDEDEKVRRFMTVVGLWRLNAVSRAARAVGRVYDH